MRYTTMLSDGDVKAHDLLVTLNVYPGRDIEKQECINHIGKRLYRALTNIVAHYSEHDITFGGAKRGSLTQDKMKKLQGYYSGAIKKNAPDVDAIKDAIYATIFHCSSTDEHLKHDFCPTGETSWCFWQRAVTKEEEPEKHSTMNTKTL